MEIKRIDNFTTQATQRSSEQNVRPAGDEKPVPGKDSTAEPDRVKLSRGYQEVAQAMQAGGDQTQIRTDRVAQVRSVVESNSYVVKPDQVAQRMLEEAW